jgi:nucleoside-diphosphate-sugar epimerase
MSDVIAVTGASGFVGGAVVRRFAAAGWATRVLVRPRSAAPVTGPVGDVVPGDLENAAALRRLVAGATAVVHCAGAIRGPTAADFHRVNVEGLARLVEAIRSEGGRCRLVLVSSLAAREPQLSPYAASKRAGEAMLAAVADVAWTIVRAPAVYGPGDPALAPLWRAVRLGILPVLGSPQARFSLLYVDDLAEAAARLVWPGAHAGRTFELHDGQVGGYTWRAVLAAARRWRGRGVWPVRLPPAALAAIALVQGVVHRGHRRPPLLTPGKVRELLHDRWVCDNAALTEATGWVPRIGLDEGMRRTLSALGRRPVDATGEESHAYHVELR